eukprot:gnl/MRDRNA2_/MRDRNA2_32575_c0_seq1.p2 gnl/MRDRNA2_/MRDRNA2_32575_c0~~gnl/MRDRNA2_/MRDRNA2_32575_c0_seq1.p2  ORF type:complete len:119 (-),score=3.66 gnl/MRDRNA2_/MRDRNA2_32575_c0_seq1:573-929(-)
MVRRSRMSRAKMDHLWQSPVEDDICVIGTLDILQNIPLALVRQALCQIPLYDRCCFGAACRQTRTAVVTVRVGIPVSQASVEGAPDTLMTPIFFRFLSAMLEFHLPRVCPHSTVLHHY